jgi:hypothetical protein
MLIAGALVGAAAVALAGLRVHDDREARRLWTCLACAPSDGPFHEDMLAHLPEAAQRYLQHAIVPGTALTTAVRLEMTDAMRLRPGAPWLTLRARQLLSPHRGFIWRARVGRGFRTFVGGDQYAKGRGAVRFWLWGALPIVRAGWGFHRSGRRALGDRAHGRRGRLGPGRPAAVSRGALGVAERGCGDRRVRHRRGAGGGGADPRSRRGGPAGAAPPLGQLDG